MKYDKPQFEVDKRILLFDIAKVLGEIGLQKALGEDLLPIGLFKAYSEPLYQVFILLVIACFRLKQFLRRFKNIKIIILVKSGKKPFNYKTPAGYKPITLLPIIKKIIKAIITEKVIYQAKNKGLLPKEQMGNR